MDVATIEARAKRQLNEPTGADEGFWSDADYLNAVNEAQREIALATKCLKTDASFTTSASTAMYDLSEASLADFLDITQVLYYRDTGIYDVLTSCNRDKLFMLRGTDSTEGTPSYYCYEDRTIEFECDTEADKTVKIFYNYLPTDIGAGETDHVPTIPTKFHQLIVDYLCWKMCESDDTKMDKVIYFRQLYADGLLKMLMILEPPGSSYECINDISEVPYV